MSTTHTLPQPADISQLFHNLVGRATKAAAVPAAPLTPQTKGVFALFADGAGAIVGVMHFDLKLACSAGAALALIPAGIAREGVTKGVVPEGILDNTKEVINVARTLIGGGAQLKRIDLALPTPIPPELDALMKKPVARADLNVEIQGYDAGRLTILVK